jgi:plasmid stability protein
MAKLTVRNVGDRLVRALEVRATAHGRSAEEEHREILSTALLHGGKASFRVRAARLRGRLRSDVDSVALVRADRDRETARRGTTRTQERRR